MQHEDKEGVQWAGYIQVADDIDVIVHVSEKIKAKAETARWISLLQV